jgi:hypothetical protein
LLLGHFIPQSTNPTIKSPFFLQKNPGHIIPQSTEKDGSSGLPLSFRSTIYLDVFGWHSRHFSAAAVVNAVDGAHHWENAEKMLYDAMETRRF